METTVEILMVATDYLGFAWEPFVEPLLARLDPKRHLTSRGPTTAKTSETLSFPPSKKGDKKGLADIDRELAEFCESQRRHLEAWQASREPLLGLVERTMESKWPWVTVHRAHQDPIDRQLNCMDCDLCLIDDWDFPLPLKPEFALGSRVNGCTVEVVHSSPSERKFFLEIVAPSTAAEGAEHQEPHKSILCIKSKNRNELKLMEARSSLLFYYTQIHPELSNLYLVVVKLLESAKLIESCTLDNDDDDKYDQLKLDRYTLVIMLVAYLGSSQAKRVGRERHALANHLIAFLSTYAYPSGSNERTPHTGICIRPTQKRAGELEILDLRDELQSLVVMDPIALVHGCKWTWIDATTTTTEGATLTNLTQKLPALTLIRVRGLFTDLSERLKCLSSDLDLDDEQGTNRQCGVFARETFSKVHAKSSGDDAALGRALAELRPQLGAGNTKRRRLFRQRMLHNLLYLALFFLIRNQLVGYLDSVRFGLQGHLREDMVQLKHSFVNLADAAETETNINKAAEAPLEEPGGQEGGATTEAVAAPMDEIWEQGETEAQKAYSEDSDEMDEMPLEELMRSLMQQALGDELGGIDLASILNVSQALGADGAGLGDKAEILSQLSGLFAGLGELSPSNQAAEDGSADKANIGQVTGNDESGPASEAAPSDRLQSELGELDEPTTPVPAASAEPKDEL